MSDSNLRHISLIEAEPRLSNLPQPARTRYAQLLGLLLAGQEQMNLTAIKDPGDIVRLHFADSLYGLDAGDFLQNAARAADVGSGAGFPLLPLAMETPGCTWVAIESIGKKARFIEETAHKLGLTNVSARHTRAEDAGRSDLRGTFDVITARAVGPIASLCEVCLPLLRVGGTLLLYKTEAALQELAAAQHALDKLGAVPTTPFHYRLKGDEQDRVILVIEKTQQTPETYPRLPGVPFKKPLH